MSLTKEQKKQRFLQNMGIAEANAADQHAVGRYAHRSSRRPLYHNMAGHSQMTPGNYQDARALSITIKNNGTTVENAILFGLHTTTETSGSNIEITSRTAPSIEAINNEVASKPMILERVKFQAGVKEQTSHAWQLNSKNLVGGSTSDIFIPEMHQKSADNNVTLIDAILPEFTASGNNWMSIPIEPGNTVTINFIPGAQLSLEGITAGTNTVQ